MSWPREIFLESTALFQLGSRLQKPEFANLLERRELLKFELLVSEVSWAEYGRQRTETVDALITDLESVGRRLGEWDQSRESIYRTVAELTEFRKGIPSLYEKKAAEAGINVLTIPTLDVTRLFRMSVGRTAPFETSRQDKTEKGFRDSLIMFRILDAIKNRPEDFALVVSNDELLTTGLNNHVGEFRSTVAVVPTLDHAITHI